MIEKIYFLLPHLFQNMLISIYNVRAYKKRYGGKYRYYLSNFEKNRILTKEELVNIQKRRYAEFIQEVVDRSPFYKNEFKEVNNPCDIESIRDLPIIKKETLRKNSESIHTITEKEGVLSKTGGTTGKSLKVVFTNDNMQERFAMLDDFRSRFGYKLGKKTAWFSGKSLLTNGDLKRNRFWKTD